MIAIDTQILVFAHKASSQWHERASERIAELANTRARWAIPMHCLVEFYANVTHPTYYRPPSTPAQAIDQIDAWLESPSLSLLSEDARTWTVMRTLLSSARIVGKPAYDARIAAVCLQHGVTELWTNDRDFLKFPALRVHNPLVDIHPTGVRERGARYVVAKRKRAAPRR